MGVVEPAAGWEGVDDRLKLSERRAQRRSVDLGGPKAQPSGGLLGEKALDGCLAGVKRDRQADALLQVLKDRLAGVVVNERPELADEILELEGHDRGSEVGMKGRVVLGVELVLDVEPDIADQPVGVQPVSTAGTGSPRRPAQPHAGRLQRRLDGHDRDRSFRCAAELVPSVAWALEGDRGDV